MKKLTIILMAALSLAACSNDREPSDKQFKKVINDYAENHGVCLPLSLEINTPQGQNARAFSTLGEPTIKIAERDTNGEKINADALKLMRLLDSEGFYDRQDSENLSLASGDVKVQVYNLTEKGNENTMPSPHGPLFCVGTQKVDKINWFTDPTPSNGVTVSKVSYEAKFKPESWAAKVLKHANENWADNINNTRTQTATLVLTNKGWKDIRELK